MPPLFSNKDIKVIEYGQYANNDISFKVIKNFIGKFLTLKTAK